MWLHRNDVNNTCGVTGVLAGMLLPIPLLSTMLLCASSVAASRASLPASDSSWLSPVTSVVCCCLPQIGASGARESLTGGMRPKGGRAFGGPGRMSLGEVSVERGESPLRALGSPLRLSSLSNGFSEGGLKGWKYWSIHTPSRNKHEEDHLDHPEVLIIIESPIRDYIKENSSR